MLALGIALSHSPTMFVPVEEWPDLHKSLVGDVPQPKALADETPEANVVSKERIDAGLDTLSAKIAKAEPDVVVIVGDDQSEVFGKAFNPTLAVYAGPKVSGVTLRRFQDKPGINHDLTLTCDADFGLELATGLIDRGFDPAVMTELRPLSRPEGLGHAFTRPAHRLGIAEADIPLVPVFLNGYHDPLPTGRRCWELGEALREIAEASDKRVVLVASGGLTHDPMGPRAGWIDERLDRWVLSRISEGRGEELAQLFAFDSDTLRGGSGEIRAWITVAGAFAGRAGTVVDYIPLHHAVTGLGLAYWEPEGE
ncbi:hypothetical protein [Streptomyces sp. T028]|uniref:DODA-type extradiol aromatic ring-opening family dioxygenase n=1 Tax=Streptomyces sp. T028 TaxID=3394379 RepID=UPI003A88534A